MSKVNLKGRRKDWRGELYGSGGYVGAIFKEGSGYKVYAIEDGIGEVLFEGREFYGSDFESAGYLQVSASRKVPKYRFAKQ